MLTALQDGGAILSRYEAPEHCRNTCPITAFSQTLKYRLPYKNKTGT